LFCWKEMSSSRVNTNAKITRTNTHNSKSIKVGNERNAFHAWWSLVVNQHVYTHKREHLAYHSTFHRKRKRKIV
jgi:hypothetical protein